jgi:hypothetical protein
MVQVDISQLSGECNVWRETLRNHREELSNDEARLRQIAGRQLSKEQLLDVEHLHNQFHIQLINIHDLKHAIKAHEQKMGYEMNVHGKLQNETLAEHENILDQFQTLDSTLVELREEFDTFLSRAS